MDLATRIARTPIYVGGVPWAIAITPDSRTAYVATVDGKLIPVDLATGTVGRAIDVAGYPDLAVDSTGTIAYVADTFGTTITPINLATGKRGTPIKFSQSPGEIVVVK